MKVVLEMNNHDIQFISFRQFWPFYISQHQNRTNRVLHVIGILAGLTVACLFAAYGEFMKMLIYTPLIGYGFAWVGHFVFEKNRPASFKYPLYSFLGDIKMTFLSILGKDLLRKPPEKMICITGAGRGIGLGLVRHFLNQGHQVIATVRKSNNTLAELSAHYSTKLLVLEMDVTEEAQIKDASTRISSLIEGKELILINNAGISGGGPFELMTSQHWHELFEINVMGLINTTRILLPLIRKTRGRVINIGSISGRVASPFLSSYAGSKYAVRGISDSLRRELGPFGVSVVLIEPGPINTGIWDTSMDRSLKMMDQGSPKTLEIYKTNIEKLKNEILNIKSSTVSVEYLTAFVDEAVSATKPKPYYRVGKNVGMIFVLSHFVPAAVLDKLLGGGLRFEKMK